MEGDGVGSMFALMNRRGHVALWCPESRPQPVGRIRVSVFHAFPSRRDLAGFLQSVRTSCYLCIYILLTYLRRGAWICSRMFVLKTNALDSGKARISWIPCFLGCDSEETFEVVTQTPSLSTGFISLYVLIMSADV